MSDTRNDMKLYTVCIEMVCVIDEIHDGICSQNDFIVQQKLSQVLKIIQSDNYCQHRNRKITVVLMMLYIN